MIPALQTYRQNGKFQLSQGQTSVSARDDQVIRLMDGILGKRNKYEYRVLLLSGYNSFPGRFGEKHRSNPGIVDYSLTSKERQSQGNADPLTMRSKSCYKQGHPLLAGIDPRPGTTENHDFNEAGFSKNIIGSHGTSCFYDL